MRVICVDDEKPVLDNFARKVKDISLVESLELFQDAEQVIEWVSENKVDVAFLDVEMPMVNGIELARRMKKIDEDIRIIFVTAYTQYALDAFRVDALGYLLKPYSKEEIKKELEKASLMRVKPKKNVKIQTMPDFVVTVNNHILHFERSKPEELLALLVDKAEVGMTVGEAIACLWPERPADESTKTLYRVTFHRLMEILKNTGIDHIIETKGRKRYLVMELVDCDLYQLLNGDTEMIQGYTGEYLKRYSWAETRNAQLNSIKMMSNKESVKV